MARQQQAALYANVQEASNGEILHKTFPVETKADDEGSFTALVSAFGNVDKGGDRMLPGSFSNTLQRWRESGKAIPVILSHQWDDLTAWVGKADPRAIFEDETGLTVQGSLFMEDEGARKVHKLMKEGLLTGWSFGYHVPKGGQAKKDGINEVSEVELFEVGPTLVGMNELAQLQEVKAAEQKELTDEEKLRRESEQAERAMIAEKLPPAAPDEKRKEYEELLEAVRNADDEHRSLIKQVLAVEDASVTVITVKDETEEETSPDPGRNEEPAEVKSPSDSLRRRSEDVVLEVASAGISLRKPSKVKNEPMPEPPSEEVLRRQSDDLMLELLIGSKE